MLRNLLILIMLLMSSTVYSKCDEDSGSNYMKLRKFKDAYLSLKDCESLKSTSGLALGQLAFLYHFQKMGSFKDEHERITKAHELFIRSALLGQRESVNYLINIYSNGEESLGIDKNECISKCLASAYKDNSIESNVIGSCLKIK